MYRKLLKIWEHHWWLTGISSYCLELEKKTKPYWQLNYNSLEEEVDDGRNPVIVRQPHPNTCYLKPGHQVWLVRLPCQTGCGYSTWTKDIGETWTQADEQYLLEMAIHHVFFCQSCHLPISPKISLHHNLGSSFFLPTIFQGFFGPVSGGQ